MAGLPPPGRPLPIAAQYSSCGADSYLSCLNLPMNWIILIIAGLFEMGFATCLGKAKETSGSASALWMGGFFICLSISMFLLYRATQTLPIGTAYAVWTGIGAAGTAIIGIFYFKEPATFWRIFFLFTLIGSVVGLKAVSD
jgi:quaternary ammonium compound-resistance protein SugE